MGEEVGEGVGVRSVPVVGAEGTVSRLDVPLKCSLSFVGALKPSKNLQEPGLICSRICGMSHLCRTPCTSIRPMTCVFSSCIRSRLVLAWPRVSMSFFYMCIITKTCKVRLRRGGGEGEGRERGAYREGVGERRAGHGRYEVGGGVHTDNRAQGVI